MLRRRHRRTRRKLWSAISQSFCSHSLLFQLWIEHKTYLPQPTAVSPTSSCRSFAQNINKNEDDTWKTQNIAFLMLSLLSLFLCSVARVFCCCQLFCRSWRHTYSHFDFVSLYIRFFPVVVTASVYIYCGGCWCCPQCRTDLAYLFIRNFSFAAFLVIIASASDFWRLHQWQRMSECFCTFFSCSHKMYLLDRSTSARLTYNDAMRFLLIYTRSNFAADFIIINLLFYHYFTLLLSWFVTSVRRINAQPFAYRQSQPARTSHKP